MAETASGWRLDIAVADTGIGIPAEARERLFDPFVQADASSARRYNGAGLGLAVARMVVEAMGGTIAVESAPGRGSTFRIAVPLARMALAPA
ncbi:ATP-binding protein [Paeniroseomonas aquatica]|uniref:ATP-binding protein n=1 Tax=Paeniroseomonas aquatica TaxID=373043 RepID=UPI00360EAB90